MGKLKELIREMALVEGNPLARLRKHIQGGRHFAILSAHRADKSPEENHKAMKSLVSKVKNQGYGYKHADGSWEGGSEKSIVVHAKDKGDEAGHQLRDDMVKHGEDHDQDSVLHHNGREGVLIGTNHSGSVGKGKTLPIGAVRYNRDKAPYQSELKPGKKNSARFTVK